MDQEIIRITIANASYQTDQQCTSNLLINLATTALIGKLCVYTIGKWPITCMTSAYKNKELAF